jgi:hypothetical protein
MHNSSGASYAQKRSMSDSLLARGISLMTNAKLISPANEAPGAKEILSPVGSSTGNAISIDRPSGLTAAKTILCLQPHGSRYRGNVAVACAPDRTVTWRYEGLSGSNSTSIPAGLVSDRTDSTGAITNARTTIRYPMCFCQLRGAMFTLPVKLLPKMPL